MGMCCLLLLYSVGNSSVRSSLCFASIPHVGHVLDIYKVSMAVWFPTPTNLWGNVDAPLSQSDLEKSHPNRKKTNPLRQQLQ